MDARLLDYYNRELNYLREMGAQFAERYPKVAGRLGMHGIEVADPYVERLLEGFSFLTARVQLKMDAQFPRFSQQLLSVLYPNYLAQTPSMAIARMTPSLGVSTLAGGFTLPAGSSLRAGLTHGEQTACEFRTGHAVTLWPLTIADVRYGLPPADLPPRFRQRTRAALRVGLQFGDGQTIADSPLDQLTFHLAGPEQRALRLLELVLQHGVGVVCRAADNGPWGAPLDPDAVTHEGFDAGQALLPLADGNFHGYRILQEYFACPARFLFFGVAQLRRALRGLPGSRFDLYILLGEDDSTLERLVNAEDLGLYCTPIVNLFPKRADPVLVSPATSDYHLVVDRSRPLDYEVHSVTNMVGHGAGQERRFRPFYTSFAADGGDYGAYYTLRREPRLLSERARQHGSRTDYHGSECYISLVDQQQAPFSNDLRHLAIDTLCTNRDLALIMPVGRDSDFTLTVSAPVGSIRLQRAPTRPHAPLADGLLAWHLISHLGLNFQGLAGADPEQGAAMLRQLLALYLHGAASGQVRQAQSVRKLECTPVYRRIPQPGPPMHGRGVHVVVTVDEQAFSGDSPYLFGAVLEQYFARHVAINQFSELSLSSTQRGAIAHWRPRLGRRPLL